MENAEPMILTEPPLKEEEIGPFYIDGNNNSLFQIEFKIKNNQIIIKGHNTSDEIPQIYSLELNSENIKNTTSFNNIREAFNNFKTLKNENLNIEKKEDYFLLHKKN